MATTQGEQAPEQFLSKRGREAADHLARAARVRGASSPMYVMLQRTMKVIDAEAEAVSVKPHEIDNLYYDLKTLAAAVLRLMKRADEEYDKRLLAILEYENSQAVIRYDEARKEAIAAADETARRLSKPASRLKRKRTT